MTQENFSNQKKASERKEKGYFEAFRESWEKVWECKTLWVWGILATFFSFSSEAPRLEPEEAGSEMNLETLRGEILYWRSWLEANLDWVWKAFLAGLVLALLLWLVSLPARGGLIRFLAGRKKSQDWKKDGKEIWKEGRRSFYRLLKLDGYFFLLLVAAFLLFASCLVGIFLWIFFLGDSPVGWVLYFLAFFLILGFSLLAILFFLVKSWADFLVVLLEKGPMEAFWEGWRIIREKSLEFVKLLGMLFLGMWLAGLVFQLAGFLSLAFFSGVQLVFKLSFLPLAQSPALSLENGPENLILNYWLVFLSLLTSGILAVFQIDYKLWWLEKNRIIRPLKKEKEKEEPAAEILSAKELETTDLPLA